MSFPKRFWMLLTAMMVVGGVAIGITSLSQNEIEGIPRRMLPVYERRVAAVKAKAQLTADLTDQAHPTVYVHGDEHDFGWVDANTSVTHAFVVENIGREALTLDIESIGCGCVVGETNPEAIPPGQIGRVPLTWNVNDSAEPDDFTEPFEKAALVRTNDPLHPMIRLVVRGEVRRDILAPQKVDFGRVNPGTGASQTFFVVSQRWPDFEIDDVVADLPDFHWTAERLDDESKLDQFHARSGYAVTIVATGQRSDDYRGTATVSITAPDSRDIRREVALTGKMRAAISFYSDDLHSQTGLDVGTLSNDEAHEWFIITRVRGPHRPSLTVLDVMPESFDASIEPLDDRGRDYRLTLRVPQGADASVFNRPGSQGYVKVGDPSTLGFNNWFPIHGAIVSPR